MRQQIALGFGSGCMLECAKFTKAWLNLNRMGSSPRSE